MKNLQKLSMTVRLIAAIAAVGVTVVLLDIVVSYAAPQRDILIAKLEHAQRHATAPVALAMVSTGADALRR